VTFAGEPALITGFYDVNARREAEEMLRASENKYRELVESINEAIYELDANGRMTYISPVVEEVAGYSPSEIVGRPATDFVHPDDVSRAVEGLQRAVSGHPTPNEYRLLSKAGEVLWVRSFGRPIFEGDRVVGVRGVLTDITDHMLAEKALRDSEERWRSLTQNAPDIIMTVDSDDTILFINRTVTGLTVERVIGTSVYSYLPPEHHDTLRKPLERVFESGEIHSYEIAGVGPFGRTSWYFSRIGPVVRDGKVVAATLITTDITEQRQAEEALRESEARLRAFANAVPDIAFILDENGVYVEVLALPDTKDLLYRDAETLKGRRLHDVLPKKSADQFLSVVRKTIKTQEPQILEYVLDVQAGRRWFEGRTAQLGLAGEKQMVVWVSRDITERKQAEAAYQKAREELDRRIERVAKRGNPYGLTFRELTVLDLVSSGKSDREIATVLGIRPRTVNKHVENIRHKMKAESRTEASVRASREGLLDQE
jgi:PAS domain S-box-containing protein